MHGPHHSSQPDRSFGNWSFHPPTHFYQKEGGGGGKVKISNKINRPKHKICIHRFAGWCARWVSRMIFKGKKINRTNINENKFKSDYFSLFLYLTVFRIIIHVTMIFFYMIVFTLKCYTNFDLQVSHYFTLATWQDKWPYTRIHRGSRAQPAHWKWPPPSTHRSPALCLFGIINISLENYHRPRRGERGGGAALDRPISIQFACLTLVQSGVKIQRGKSITSSRQSA